MSTCSCLAFWAAETEAKKEAERDRKKFIHICVCTSAPGNITIEWNGIKNYADPLNSEMHGLLDFVIIITWETLSQIFKLIFTWSKSEILIPEKKQQVVTLLKQCCYGLTLQK